MLNKRRVGFYYRRLISFRVPVLIYFELLAGIKENLMAINKELLEILACPKCKGNIYLNDTQDGLICDNCKLLYEIKDDIPIMLIDEAKSING